MAKKRSETVLLLVSRLVARATGPFEGWVEDYPVNRAVMRSEFVDHDDRDDDYDRGRILFFINQLNASVELDPIDVYAFRGAVHVDDGNHRLAAYIVTGRRVVRAEYTGGNNALRYLQGKQRTISGRRT